MKFGLLSRFVFILTLLFTSLIGRDISIEQNVAGLYIAYFNRAPDKSGLDYWRAKGEEATNSGKSTSDVLKELSSGFASHPTFISTYGDLDNKAFVEAIYQNVLGKAGDSEGVAYWTGSIDSGKSRSDMVSDFVQASLGLDLTKENFPNLSDDELRDAQERQDLITNKVEVGLNFTNILGDLTNITDNSNPENDPAYQASIKILEGITADRGTVDDRVQYLNIIRSQSNPIAEINGERSNSLYDCDGNGTIKYSYGEYNGECKRDKRDGYGVMRWIYGENNETVYKGYWRDDKQNDYGEIEYYWGGIYKGNWIDNNREGNGTYYYKSGSIYKGEWKNDQPNGYGIIEYSWGDKYEGSWKDWDREGNGTYHDRDGSIYKGEWKNDKKDGKGSYTSQEGIFTGVWKDGNLIEVTNQDSYEEAYTYFNKIRKQAGMIELKRNGILEESAKSHANYVVLNIEDFQNRKYTNEKGLTGHNEEEGKEGFTGFSPADRAVAQGYLTYYGIGEGMTARHTAKMSINNLMTAIYHRFGILSLGANEVGIGFIQRDDMLVEFIHDTGNSNLNYLCEYNSYISGSYYSDVCVNGYWISVDDYKNAFNSVRKLNPKYVLWPPKNSKNNLYKFVGEVPNPIPDYENTGNPISIQFNNYYYPNKIEMKSFKLFKDNREIKEIRIITEKTDPNKLFSEYNFALFPLDILEKNQEYIVEFKYIYNGEEKSIIWNFKTIENF